MSLLNNYKKVLALAIKKSAQIDKLISEVEGVRELLGSGSTDDKDKVLWRTPEDKTRQEKHARHRDLFFGDHEKHYKPRWMPDARGSYKVYNICRFLTNLYADLTAGKGATIKTGIPEVDSFLTEQLEIQNHLKKWIVNASIFGFVGLQVVQDDNGVGFEEIEPEAMYPHFLAGSVDEFDFISKKVYVDVTMISALSGGQWQFDKDKNDGVVFEERHSYGYVAYYLYAVKDNEIVAMLPPRWYNPDLPALDDGGRCIVETGLDELMLLVIPNQLIQGRFVSDYDDIESIQSSVNLRGSQIDRVLNIHGNPKMLLPDSYRRVDPITGRALVQGLQDEVIYVGAEEKEIEPKYLTWDAQLEAAGEAIDRDLAMFCAITGVHPALLYKTQTTFPESAAALRMYLTLTLNKIKSKEEDFTKYFRRFLWVLIKKLHANGDMDFAPMGVDDVEELSLEEQAETRQPIDQRIANLQADDIQVTFLPAIPQDERFLVERVGDKPTASRRRVLIEVDGMSEKEADEELAIIDADQQEADANMARSSGLSFGLPDIAPVETAKPPSEMLDAGLTGIKDTATGKLVGGPSSVI